MISGVHLSVLIVVQTAQCFWAFIRPSSFAVLASTSGAGTLSTTALGLRESFAHRNRVPGVPGCLVHTPVPSDCCWSRTAKPSCLKVGHFLRHHWHCSAVSRNHAETGAWPSIPRILPVFLSGPASPTPLLFFFFLEANA